MDECTEATASQSAQCEAGACTYAVRDDWSNGGADDFGHWAEFELAGVKARMRYVSPGPFTMGSPTSEAGRRQDEQQHPVELTQGYWLGETEVTQALWQAVMGSNPSRFVTATRPVELVSWQDAFVFIEALNRQVPQGRFRLPTEAEWEYASRAGTQSATHLGDLEILAAYNAPLLDSISWYGGNSGVDFELDEGHDASAWVGKQYPFERAGSHPVAGKLPNPLGLYDMLGGVWEWCADWYGSYANSLERDPKGPTLGSQRVIRGGAWDAIAGVQRSACRAQRPPDLVADHIGFRLARDQVQ